MPGRTTIWMALVFAASVMLLAACGDEDEPATATPNGGSAPTATGEPAPTETEPQHQPDLNGTAWLLSAIGGADIDLQEPITLSFNDGQAGGFSGCNDYGGVYTASESGDFTVSDLSQTDMACESGMDLEADYLEALQQAEHYEFTEGQRLELAGGNGETLLVFSRDNRLPLDGTSWNVAAINGEPIIDGTDVNFRLRAGEITGSGGCNQFGGVYSAGGDGTFSVSQMYWTEMGCLDPEGVMEQEQKFFEALQDAASYRHNESSLFLLDDTDVVLLELELRSG